MTGGQEKRISQAREWTASVIMTSGEPGALVPGMLLSLWDLEALSLIASDLRQFEAAP